MSAIWFPNRLSIPEKQFAMKYEPISRNSKHVDAISSAVESAENVYLATDPDREGKPLPGIFWKFCATKADEVKNVQRVVFHEITQTAVKDAVANPREVSMDLVNASKATRTGLSGGFQPVAAAVEKIRRGLSAGRVQSPALRLICEREAEIRLHPGRILDHPSWTAIKVVRGVWCKTIPVSG